MNLTPDEEARLATFFADPRWREIRPLLDQLAPGVVGKIDAITRRVRRELWRDFSEPT